MHGKYFLGAQSECSTSFRSSASSSINDSLIYDSSTEALIEVMKSNIYSTRESGRIPHLAMYYFTPVYYCGNVFKEKKIYHFL